MFYFSVPFQISWLQSLLHQGGLPGDGGWWGSHRGSSLEVGLWHHQQGRDCYWIGQVPRFQGESR
jgi:hypothetical protein